MTSGQSYAFRWQFTANHSTTDFKYYVTKNGWTGTKALTRADLEPQPFLTVAYNGARPAMTTVHQGAMPSGKTSTAPDPGRLDRQRHPDGLLRLLRRSVLT